MTIGEVSHTKINETYYDNIIQPQHSTLKTCIIVKTFINAAFTHFRNFILSNLGVKRMRKLAKPEIFTLFLLSIQFILLQYCGVGKIIYKKWVNTAM